MSLFKKFKTHARLRSVIFFAFCSLMLTTISGVAAGQTDSIVGQGSIPAANTANTNKIPPPSQPLRDSIISILNLSSANDTIRSKEMIAIKYQGTLPADSLQTLYIDGIAVPNVKPWKNNPQDRTVFFSNNEAVQSILLNFAEGKENDNPFIPVNFGIGTSHKQFIASKAVIYVEIHQKIGILWFVVAGILVAGLIILALSSNVLKDNNNLYYSLGSSQLFFWTLLFIVAYMSICFKTNSLPDIPSSVLIIIGISVTTTGVSRAIDSNAKNKIPIDPQAESEGFVIDILSDGSSVNIQRLQTVAFNLFFGILFLQKALSEHVLPDFDQNVLILLGVSSGAYAGLKPTEKAKDQTEPPGPTVGDETKGGGDGPGSTSGAGAAGNNSPSANQAGSATVNDTPGIATGTDTAGQTPAASSSNSEGQQ